MPKSFNDLWVGFCSEPKNVVEVLLVPVGILKRGLSLTNTAYSVKNARHQLRASCSLCEVGINSLKDGIAENEGLISRIRNENNRGRQCRNDVDLGNYGMNLFTKAS